MKTKTLMLALTSVAVLSCGCAATVITEQPANPPPETVYQPVDAPPPVYVEQPVAVPPPMPAYQPLSDQQLDQLLGPIALYPDPLVAIILPAATLPAQVVTADRYISGGGDPNEIDQQPWDVSVQGLARYPAVLQYMDNNLNWTTEMGQAFLNQQQQVMDSIQRLRLDAQNYGNLQSSPQTQVVEDDGDIEILPADPTVIYVPTYQPDYVYYRSGFMLSFGSAFRVGPWLDHDFDWHHHDVVVWDQNHPRPDDWWHERPQDRDNQMAREKNVWHPEDHHDQANVRQGDRGWKEPAVRTPEQHNEANVHNPRPGSETRPAQPHPVDQHPVTMPRPEAPHPQPMPAPRPESPRPEPVSAPRPEAPHPQPVVTPRPEEPHPQPVTAPRPEPSHQQPVPAPRPEAPRPQPVRQTEPAHNTPPARPAQPVSTGALVGSGSSRDARDFSNRGQQSMQSVTHTAPEHSAPPAPRPAPSAPNGGGHGGDQKPRH